MVNIVWVSCVCTPNDRFNWFRYFLCISTRERDRIDNGFVRGPHEINWKIEIKHSNASETNKPSVRRCGNGNVLSIWIKCTHFSQRRLESAAAAAAAINQLQRFSPIFRGEGFIFGRRDVQLQLAMPSKYYSRQHLFSVGRNEVHHSICSFTFNAVTGSGSFILVFLFPLRCPPWDHFGLCGALRLSVHHPLTLWSEMFICFRARAKCEYFRFISVFIFQFRVLTSVCRWICPNSSNVTQWHVWT